MTPVTRVTRVTRVSGASIAALIFDVDGTLADTEQAHRASFNQAFHDHGLAWEWDVPTYRGLLAVTGGKERIAAHIATLPATPAERSRLLALVPAIHVAKNSLYTARVAAGEVPLREGVARLLDEALTAGCRLAIASTTTAANVEALLQATLGRGGPGLFSAIGCGDMVSAKKPAPDIYRWVLAALDLQPQRAVAFEDSVAGLHAATAAGLSTVVTPTTWTAGADFSRAALVLPNLGDPSQPLPGEPGCQLLSAAWLTWAELAQRLPAPHAPPPHSHR